MDENNMIPELTLDPVFQNDSKPAPELTLEKKVEAFPEEANLTPEEKAKIDQFAKQIDITNTNLVLQYGAASQNKIASFSDTALQKVRTKDLGEVGDMISSLVVELKGFDVDASQKGGLFGLFKKASNSIAALKARYDKTSVNVNKIVQVLENHQVVLMKDIAVLEELYNQNLLHFKELNMYILAGKQRLREVEQNELPALVAKAKETGLPEDAQKANDLSAFCNRFEKKLHDLELTRTVCMQMAPQIRLLQNNDSMMTEKIQSTLNNTIPLWKSQMVIALGLTHSQQALAAQREVTDMTNTLLKKNADNLKIATVETARESQRGIVDIETLKHTNESLITTLDEVARIQEEGRNQRHAAEEELHKIESELKQKLLEVRNQSQQS